MRHRTLLVATIAAGALALAACGGGNPSPPAADPGAVLGDSDQRPAATAATPHPGRLLASGCFGCHGTDGFSNGGFETLAGKSAAELREELREMARADETSIMRPHAASYSDAQLWQLADYFARQKR